GLRAQLLLSRRHRLGAQIKQALLVCAGCFANYQRVGEVAAVTADDDGVIKDEHVAGFEDARGGWTAAALGAWRDGEIAVDDNGLARRLDAGAIDAAIDAPRG